MPSSASVFFNNKLSLLLILPCCCPIPYAKTKDPESEGDHQTLTSTHIRTVLTKTEYGEKMSSLGVSGVFQVCVASCSSQSRKKLPLHCAVASDSNSGRSSCRAGVPRYRYLVPLPITTFDVLEKLAHSILLKFTLRCLAV